LRPSAVVELPNTVEIRISVTSDQKLAKLAKINDRAYLAEVTSCQSFRWRVFTQPRPLAAVDSMPSERLRRGATAPHQWLLQRRIEVAKELLRVLSVTDELAKTSWPDPDLRRCQQDVE